MRNKKRAGKSRRRNGRFVKRNLGVLEALEERVVLNAAPIAVDDPTYITALNTAVNITGSLDLLDNDWDSEGSSLTATLVTNPANGAISNWNGATGTLTYTPNNGFTGEDLFTYKVSDGTSDSNIATVKIAVGKYLGAMTNREDAPRGNPLLTGELELVEQITPGLNLLYNSGTVNPKPIVVVETFLKTTSTKPTSMKAQLTLNGTTGTQYTYSTTPLSSGDSMRFALQGDASGLATGRYAWSMKITTVYSGVDTDHTYSGFVDVVNRSSSSSPFGRGWQLQGLDSLAIGTGGVLLVKDTGDAMWFAEDGAGGYLKAEGDPSGLTLVKNGDNTYTLTDKHGIEANFGTTGLLTSRVDRNGNTWEYGYSSGLLTSIEDPFGRPMTLSYTSGRLTGVSDFASRSASLTYNTTHGHLATIVGVDPDGGGALSAGTTTFTTNTTTHKVTNREDAIGNDTGFTYSTANGTLTTITHPDTETTQLVALQTRGLPTGTTGNALTGLSVFATVTNERGYGTNYDLDRFGNPISVKDPLNNVTTIERNHLGQPVRITSADPDSGGPLTSSVVVMGYSAGDNNLVFQKNPDNSTKSWTYTTFNLPATATDELSRTEEYGYDAYGNMTSFEDAGGFVWTFTYTAIGLVDVATTPDPDSGGLLSAIATDHNYDAYGRLIKIINPDSSEREFTYNTADQLLTEIDELNNTTTYVVDALDRVTKVTDRTGAEFEFVYNAVGWLTQSLDPYDQPTDYTYNVRGWLIEKEAPDPDGAGSLPRPTQTWDYDEAGNLIEEGSFSWTGGAGVQHTYNAAGWLIATAGPLSGVTMNYTRDNLGRVTAATDSINHEYNSTHYAYDSSSRVIQVKRQDADGAGPLGQPTQSYSYDAAGQLISYQDERGYTTAYVYNSRGLLEETVLPDPDGDAGARPSPVVTSTFDNIGRKISEIDPLGRETLWEYNNRHWVTSITLPDPDQGGAASSPVIGFSWDVVGNRISVTDALSRVTTSDFDEEGREIERTYSDPDSGGPLAAPVEQWEYNLAGSLVLYVDPRGGETAFDYDHLQREIERTLEDPDGGGGLTSPVFTTEYGSHGQVSKLIDALGRETTFQYDTIGRRTGVTDHEGNQTTTSYNTFNQITSIVTADPDGVGAQTASTTNYAYNRLNEVATITDALSGVTTFGYDLAGNLLTLDDPVGNTTIWAYDGLGLPTIETNELSLSRSFLHDDAGNLTRYTDRNGRVVVYGRDDLDRVTTEKWYSNATPAPNVGIATTTQGGSVNEVQRVGYNVSGMIMGGTFTITHDGETTSPIAYNATAATVKSALEALSSIGSGNVAVVQTQTGTFVYEWQLTFQGSKPAQTSSSRPSTPPAFR